MNKFKLFIATICFMSVSLISAGQGYTLVVEGFDWGPSASKVILPIDDLQKNVDANNFSVFIHRQDDNGVITGNSSQGNREVVSAYISDVDGNRITEGNHIALILQVGPDMPLSSPMAYLPVSELKGRYRNQWIDYQLTIVAHDSQKVWNCEERRIHGLVDDYTLNQTYNYGDNLSMNYAYFAPDHINDDRPLIIWLHGGGEGGYDTSVPLMANKAANYASDEIQLFFDGAYVLVPQSPTWWMMTKDSIYTRGAEDDVYFEALMDLIDQFSSAHRINKDRIYVGGCSNGGYMSLKLITEYPEYFAAAYISSLATDTQFISDKQINTIKKMPIWFVHSADDTTTLPEETVVPLYHRLIKAGAKNVHFSFFDHVIDQSGVYGGADYYYFGHSSWNYVHTNSCTYDFDGEPVKVNGQPVTIMQWLSMQTR